MNEKWIEDAKDNFGQAVDEGNYTLCKDIIADVQEAGFLDEGRALNDLLRAVPVSKFITRTPYEY